MIFILEDFRVLIFLHMVESYLMATTGLKLFGYKPSLKSLFFIAFLQGLAIWLVRGVYQYYHIPFGTHTLVLTVVLILLLRILTKASWDVSLGSALISASLVMLGSGIAQLVVQSFRLNMLFLNINPWLHILIGFSECFFLVLLLIINAITGFTIVRKLGINDSSSKQWYIKD